MMNLYYTLYSYVITVMITMAAMGYEFAPIPLWGIW